MRVPTVCLLMNHQDTPGARARFTEEEAGAGAAPSTPSRKSTHSDSDSGLLSHRPGCQSRHPSSSTSPHLRGCRRTPPGSTCSPGMTGLHWETVRVREPGGQQEGDAWTRPSQLSLALPSPGRPRSQPGQGLSQGPHLCVPRVQPPAHNFSQRSSSILRTWDAFFKREGCEISGRRCQARPMPAGVSARILREDTLWINCPPAQITRAL